MSRRVCWWNRCRCLVLGLGLGLEMQVLVIAVQNAVDYRNLGAMTSDATFFRSIGGSFGTAIFGAIFSNQLAAHLAPLASSLPSGIKLSAAESVAAIRLMPLALQAEVVHAYALSLSTVFLVAVPIAALAFILSWLLPEVPLRTPPRLLTWARPSPCQRPAPQRRRSSALQVLASRESQEQFYRRLAARAGVELDPHSTWLLFRLQEQAPISQRSLAQRFQVPADWLTSSIETLREQGLVTMSAPVDGQGDGQLQVTPAGQEALKTMTSACHDSLAELLDGWSPEQEAELATLLHRVITNLLGEQNTALAQGPSKGCGIYRAHVIWYDC
jgi:DNA-binding MarR family transcriptional regulator